MKRFLLAGLIFFSGAAGLLAKQPNIIFMLADDLGYGDLSSYNPTSEGEAPNNTPIRTPILDSMAQDGVRYRFPFGGSDLFALASCPTDWTLSEPTG